MMAVFAALGPIFAVIVFGHLLRRGGFPGEAFWPAAEKLTYFVLFPALLVRNLATVKLGNIAIGQLALVIVILLLVMTVLVFALKPLFGHDGPAFSSLYQGSIRFNTYVGLAAAAAVFGADGSARAALAIAILIPLVNVLCVTVITHAVQAGEASPGGLARALIGNPLIVGCLAGIALNATGLGLPLGSATVLDILARAALPLGLLAVGAGLRVRVAFDRKAILAVVTILKLLVLPGLAWGLAMAVGMAPLETAIIVLFAALPGAPSAYILARQLGGDADLMAAMITLQTVVSLITLPLWIRLFI